MDAKVDKWHKFEELFPQLPSCTSGFTPQAEAEESLDQETEKSAQPNFHIKSLSLYVDMKRL